MSIKVDSGRQEVVAAIVDFDHNDVESGVTAKAIYLPRGAVIVGGMVAALTAFDSATSDSLELTFGDKGDSLGEFDIASEGATEIEPSGQEYPVGGVVNVTWTGAGDAPTAGRVRIVLRYVVVGRAAFSHGPDVRVPDH